MLLSWCVLDKPVQLLQEQLCDRWCLKDVVAHMHISAAGADPCVCAAAGAVWHRAV